MATEYPALNRIHVVGYSANDTDYPILGLVADPRVAGYKVPEDFSVCPDKRYPNHIFTGAQPISGDQRVRHTWEILPSPWVPFTRYDDDLGPVQGRRRSVKNEGQVASLAADKRTTYEAREGSAIVYMELEETWSIKTDDDGNSLFPIRIRDFYDASRGAMEETRQLFVPTGEEKGSLENVNGVITQTSYEPYNEFISVKIVQRYKVNGPQLIGKTTDNDGQLVTVTTQRKGALDYTPPNPTSTRTVEVSREDAESIVERVVDTPEVFSSKVLAKEAVDPAPAKFRVASPTTTEEETIEGTIVEPELEDGDISKSEQQINKFVKRLRSTFRNLLSLPKTLTQKQTNNQGQIVKISETLQRGDTTETPNATKTIQSEALGDGTYVVTKTEIPSVFPNKTIRKTRDDLTPQKFRGAQSDTVIEENVAGTISSPSSIVLGAGEFAKSEEQVTEFVKRVSTNTRDISATSTITETVITNEGQTATRTLRLSSEGQSIQPDALLIDGSIEALGDGRTIKTETRVEDVFDGLTITSSRPDVIPERFRASIPNTTVSEIKEGGPSLPVLGDGEFEKTSQKQTNFTVRETTVSRGTLYATDELSGIEYEESFDFGIPYIERIAESIEDGISADIAPIGDGKYLVREYNKDEIESSLEAFYEKYPTRTNLNLPKILKSISLVWDKSETSGEQISDSSYSGAFTSITLGDNGQNSLDVSVTPQFNLQFEEVNGSNIFADTHLFFLRGPVTLEKILEKCQADKVWPVFKTKSYTFTSKGAQVSAVVDASYSISINANPVGLIANKNQQFKQSRSITNIVLNIPPCIHANLVCKDANNATSKTASASASVYLQIPYIGSLGPYEKTVTETVDVNISLSQTSPPDIPRNGIYLIDSTVEPYKYGFFLVRAMTINASNFA